MTIDKSLKTSKGIVRARNVLNRAERIEKLKEQDRWSDDGSTPYSLPKVRVYKVVINKKKKKKGEEEGAAAASAEAAKKPAASKAGAAKPAAKPAAKK
ncbi:MAG: small basic protein [Planctomycetaceae bacterium]|jgi:small basic protein (TIGR04137 family)|nr:small basic protein [Planctomycetaceae bacterium]